MNYFKGITDIEQAKQHYRILAKQLHPDKEGTALEFQEMQDEYKGLIIQLQQNHNTVTPLQEAASLENELINELGRLAKVLIKKLVPQNYLRQKIKITESPLKKCLFSDIVDFLNRL